MPQDKIASGAEAGDDRAAGLSALSEDGGRKLLAPSPILEDGGRKPPASSDLLEDGGRKPPASSVRTVAGAVGAILDPTLSSYLEDGETIDGAASFQLAMTGWLEDGQAELESLEAAHREAEQHLKDLRLGCDAHYQELYERLLSVRRTFEDAFGRGTAAVYLGLDPKLGEVSRDVFERYARFALRRLGSPAFTTPPPKVDGIWDRPLYYAEQLRASLDGFAAALAAITAQKRRVESTLLAKSEKLAELKSRLRWSTRFFEALFHLAGLGFHAERLRAPARPRPQAESRREGS